MTANPRHCGATRSWDLEGVERSVQLCRTGVGFGSADPATSAINSYRLCASIDLSRLLERGRFHHQYLNRDTRTSYHDWKSTHLHNRQKRFTMGKGNTIPDAWDDDDWEVQADQAPKEEPSKPEIQAPLSRAERLAKHAEEQRKLWEAAYVALHSE